jgi:hypothetical protein
VQLQQQGINQHEEKYSDEKETKLENANGGTAAIRAYMPQP